MEKWYPIILPFLGLSKNGQSGEFKLGQDWTKFALHMMVIILIAMMGYGISRIDALGSSLVSLCSDISALKVATARNTIDIQQHVTETNKRLMDRVK